MVFSRPNGTHSFFKSYPGLTSWAILRRPCGTEFEGPHADFEARRSVRKTDLRAFRGRVRTGKETAGPSTDEHVQQARSALNKLEDKSLADPWKLLSKGNVLIQGTRYQMIRSLVLNHAIHHRGQLGVYLRLNNVAVPSIYGPSADES